MSRRYAARVFAADEVSVFSNDLNNHRGSRASRSAHSPFALVPLWRTACDPVEKQSVQCSAWATTSLVAGENRLSSPLLAGKFLTCQVKNERIIARRCSTVSTEYRRVSRCLIYRCRSVDVMSWGMRLIAATCTHKNAPVLLRDWRSGIDNTQRPHKTGKGIRLVSFAKTSCRRGTC